MNNEASEKKVSLKSHTPVLPIETVESLALQETDIVFDGTTGLGGHAAMILPHITKGKYIAVDADGEAQQIAKEKLQDFPHVEFVELNFRNIETILKELHIEKVDKILLDLGWGSHHLTAGRGFTFLKDEPLDMNYGITKETKPACTARDIVNEWSEDTLIAIFEGFGEERFAKRIADAIVHYRKRTPIETTFQIVDIIEKAVPKAWQPKRIHPATKVFQALRIAANDEFGALGEILNYAPTCVRKGGRIAILTFHSIEDRIVKQKFLEWEKSGLGNRYTKKPVMPTRDEVKKNPRSRSGKLRTFIFNS